MQLLLPIGYSILFILLICRAGFFAVERITRVKLVALFLLKLGVGAVVWFIYTTHYSFADFQTYFSDSRILIKQVFGNNDDHQQMIGWNTSFEPILFNNSRTMVVLNAVIQLFSFGNLFVHIVFFCFFSFIGLTAFYKAFIYYFPGKQIQLIISIFLIPSVLFWSSGVSKESVVILITGLVIYISHFGLKPTYSLGQGVMVIILLGCLAFVKIYVAIALIPLLVVNGIIARTSGKHIFFKYLFVFALSGLLAFIIQLIIPEYDLLKIISDKQSKAISEARGGVFLENNRNFICVEYDRRSETLIPLTNNRFKIKEGGAYLSWKLDNMTDTTFVTNSKDTATYSLSYTAKPANTVLELKRLRPKLIDFIMYSPHVVLNVLFQPTFFNIKSWLHAAIAVENMWLITFLLLAIIFFDKTIIGHKEVILFSLLFAFILFALIGITTPVIGSAVRYRTIGLLFFVPVLLMCIDEGKIKKRIVGSER